MSIEKDRWGKSEKPEVREIVDPLVGQLIEKIVDSGLVEFGGFSPISVNYDNLSSSLNNLAQIQKLMAKINYEIDKSIMGNSNHLDLLFDDPQVLIDTAGIKTRVFFASDASVAGLNERGYQVVHRMSTFLDYCFEKQIVNAEQFNAASSQISSSGIIFQNNLPK